MTTEATVLPPQQTAITRKPWIAPALHIVDINAAQGAQAGSMCDKHGSLSGTIGNDKCNPATK